MIAEHYALVKLNVQEDHRNTPGAEQLLDQTGGAQAGLPFFAFLDKTGTKIANSCAMPGGRNIGYPGNPEELKAFDGLLEQTAPRMTLAQRTMLAEQLRRGMAR
jgi:hypothetical protein